jgi:hypothetical protein
MSINRLMTVSRSDVDHAIEELSSGLVQRCVRFGVF